MSSTSQENNCKAFRTLLGTLKCFSVKMSGIKEIIDTAGQQALKFQSFSFILHI